MPIEISYLADHPEWIAAVGNWYRDEWESIWEPNSFSGWWDVGCEHANYSALPLAFAAHNNGKLVGAAGLDAEAFAPALQHCRGPWLSGLFSDDPQRSADVKSMLVHQVLETAKHFGFPHVTTMCRVKNECYNYKGRRWELKEELVLNGREINVLTMGLA